MHPSFSSSLSLPFAEDGELEDLNPKGVRNKKAHKKIPPRNLF